MELLSTDPLILTIDSFLTDEECNHVIKISKDKLAKAKTCYYSKEEQKKIEDINYKGRTNKSCWLEADTDKIIKSIFNKASKLLNTDYTFFETLQVIYYKTGEEYKHHFDAWDKEETEKFEKYTSERGNRVFTLLFYLNDVIKGGETEFNMTKTNIKVKCKKGKALLFKNTNEDGSLNKHSLHAGLSVIEGEKWGCNLWLREKPKVSVLSDDELLLDDELDLNYIERNSSDEELDLNYIELE
jgi:prolyl 4-hydroxylase